MSVNSCADDKTQKILLDPSKALKSLASTTGLIDKLVRHVIGTQQRADRKRTDGEFDDFKVDFKNEGVLRALRKQAREQYVYAIGLDDGV